MNMKPFILLIIAFVLQSGLVHAQNHIVTTDIDNFWNAYDHIIATKDTELQHSYLNELFIAKGTPGLKGIIQVRNYTDQSYLAAVRSYPLFWQSIRSNTLKAKTFSMKINHGIRNLKQLYPELKPSIIYFTIGALKTNGTTQKDKILIGSELALADSATNTSEFPATLNHLKQFFKSNPIQSVVFGNVHEYVHTQQKSTVANSLLGQCLLEGVAEFLAVKATGQSSPTPAVAYGAANDDQIKAVFSEQMFHTNYGFWLYSNETNEFGMRDLGYYVGYAICQKYYANAIAKHLAIKEMIELDYNDKLALSNFVDKSHYFDKPLAILDDKYEATRPKVIGIDELKNTDMLVNPGIERITVNFSAQMNTTYRGFDFGPLGEANVLKIKRFIGFSQDGKSVSFEIELKPGNHYQLLLTDRFQDNNGKPLKPYLIDFTTSNL